MNEAEIRLCSDGWIVNYLRSNNAYIRAFEETKGTVKEIN